LSSLLFSLSLSLSAFVYLFILFFSFLIYSVFVLQVATASQFFISYTIRTFGALTFATIMTTRQVNHNSQIILETFLLMMLLIDGVFSFSLVLKLVSIMLSCVWFKHPLSWEQGMGAVSLDLNPNSIFAFFIIYFIFFLLDFLHFQKPNSIFLTSIRWLSLVPYMQKCFCEQLQIRPHQKKCRLELLAR
jgi:hypothetical protein